MYVAIATVGNAKKSQKESLFFICAISCAMIKPIDSLEVASCSFLGKVIPTFPLKKFIPRAEKEAYVSVNTVKIGLCIHIFLAMVLILSCKDLSKKMSLFIRSSNRM